LKFDPGRLIQNLADSKLKAGWVKKKQEKKKADMTRLTRWIDPTRPGCKPVNFWLFFLLKRHRFDFKKNDPADLVTQSKPRTRVLDRADHRAGS